ILIFQLKKRLSAKEKETITLIETVAGHVKSCLIKHDAEI
uniref:Uncharacterized protein n=1 Tax=Romanomermis culicivorax TaxID=13658 RepID=A0A915IXZ3_ROMCU